VILNGQALPNLPCCHVRPCTKQGVSMVYIDDVNDSQTTYDPTAPLRMGALPVQSTLSLALGGRPRFSFTPGNEMDILAFLQDGTVMFKSSKPKMFAPYYERLVNGNYGQVPPGVHTLSFVDGISHLACGPFYHGKLLNEIKVELAPGVLFLFNIKLESGNAYKFICSPITLTSDTLIETNMGMMIHEKAVSITHAILHEGSGDDSDDDSAWD